MFYLTEAYPTPARFTIPRIGVRGENLCKRMKTLALVRRLENNWLETHAGARVYCEQWHIQSLLQRPPTSLHRPHLPYASRGFLWGGR